MHSVLRHILLISGLLFANLSSCLAATEVVTFNSGPQQTTLLELYTSEGCSSCPPADRWLSQFTHDPRLWSQVVPVAFHVDYWNYLGWSDRFSRAPYSERQRQYASKHYSKSVYTPGFFSNGREWRAWFYRGEPDFSRRDAAGILHVTISSTAVEGRFAPQTGSEAELKLNLAVLGFNLTTQVAGGENQGKQLHHDFVVLSLHSYETQAAGGTFVWQLPLPPALHQTGAEAVAIWISRVDDPTPIQATGGWLAAHSNK